MNLGTFVMIVGHFKILMRFMKNLKNVHMIPTRILGVSVFFSLFFCSCISLDLIEKSGKTYQDANFYYVNDSLQFSYAFPADYIPLKRNKRNRAASIAKIPFKSQYCIAAFKTTEPDLEHFLYYFKGKAKDTLIVDSTLYLLYRIFPLSDTDYIVLVAHSDQKSFFNLKREYLDFVFENMKKEKDYRNIKFSNPFDVASYCFQRNDSLVNYVLPILNLENRKENYYSFFDRSLFLQAILSYYAMISNTTEQQKAYFNLWLNTKPKPVIYRSDFYNEKALDYLITKCEKEKVIMCNENHFDPTGRLWIRLLLDPLYENGFRYLALEALWENDSILLKRGFPIAKSGFYTQEPFMAELIREAIEIGYTVIGYDDWSKDREKMQAQNLYEKTLAKDSSAKVLVLAGFEHISKNTKRQKRMALYFDSISNVSPFCIDQTQGKTTETNRFCILDSLSGITFPTTADIYVENHWPYENFAKQKAFQNYIIKFPKGIQKKIRQGFIPGSHVLSIYVKSEKEIDYTAIPVFNYILNDKDECKKIGVYLDPKREYVYVLRNIYGVKIFENLITENI